MGLELQDLNPFTAAEQLLYWKAVVVNYDDSVPRMYIRFNGFVSRDVMLSGAKPVQVKEVVVQGVDLATRVPPALYDQVKAAIYMYVKQPDQPFAAAQDVLEPGQP